VLAAMNAALDIFIDEGDTVYPHLRKIADALCSGLRTVFAEAGVDAQVQQVNGMWQVFFCHKPVERFRQGRRNDGEFYHHFQMEMQARGVYFHNYQMERWFASTEHTLDDVAITLEKAKDAVEAVKTKLGRTVVSEH